MPFCAKLERACRAVEAARRSGEAHQRECAGASEDDVAVRLQGAAVYPQRQSSLRKSGTPGFGSFRSGHVGDGNVHLALLPPADADPAVFLKQSQAIMDTVNEVVGSLTAVSPRSTESDG